MPRINTVQDEATPMTAEEFAAEIRETVDAFAATHKADPPVTFARWLAMYREWLGF